MRPAGSPAELERRRLRAVELLAQGHPPVEVARMVGVDRRSVRRWKAAFRKKGRRAIAARPACGRPPKLSPSLTRRLERALLRGAQAAGFPTDLWTCPRVAQLIAQRFRIRYHVDHLGRLLHALGWSPQKPARRAVERDEEAIQGWVKQTWPALKKKAHRLNAWLIFLDECGFLMAPLVRRSWQPRGRTPVVVQRGRHLQKVSAIAALAVSPRRDRLRLYFRLHPQADIGSDQVIAFLRYLHQELREPCLLVWDRLNAHRAKRTTQFVARLHHLHTFFLPAYAPELNPVEYAWSYLKMNPLANRPTFATAELAALARRHTRALQRNQSLLRSFLRHSPLFLRLT